MQLNLLFSIIFGLFYIFLINNFGLNLIACFTIVLVLFSFIMLLRGEFKTKSLDFFLIFTFFFSGVLSFLLSGRLDVFFIMFPVLTVHLVVSSSSIICNRKNLAGQSNYLYLFYLTLLSTVLMSLLFFSETHGERQSLIWVTDPNYTALILMSPCILYITSVFKGSLNFSFVFSNIMMILFFSLLFYLTQSRAFFLSVLLFYLSFTLFYLKKFFLLRFSSYLILFVPFIFQLIIGYFFLDTIEIVNLNDGNRLTNINDDSNFARLSAFLTSLINANSSDFYFTGVRLTDFIKSNGINDLPHNWTLMVAISSGWFFTFILVLILVRVLHKVEFIYLPFLISILFFGSVLGHAIFIVIFYLFFFSLILKKKVY